jgi:hypothetical protein
MSDERTRYHLIQHIDGNAGFCAILTYTLNGIRMAVRDGAIPVVYYGPNSTRFFYEPLRGDNVWEYFFEPVSSVSWDALRSGLASGEIHPEQVHSFDRRQIFDWHHSDPDRIATFWARDVPADPAAWMAAKRELGRKFVREFIRVKPHVTQKVDGFWSEHMGPDPVLGVHIRGTDFAYAEPTPPSSYFEAIDRYVEARHTDSFQLFLATDQSQFVDLFRDRYGKRIVATDSLRSSSQRPPFKFARESPYRRGEDVLIDLLLLSRCEFVFKGAAAVGECALWLNPALECHDFALTSQFDPRTIEHLVSAWRKLEIDQWSPPPWHPRRWQRALDHRLGPLLRRVRGRG